MFMLNSAARLQVNAGDGAYISIDFLSFLRMANTFLCLYKTERIFISNNNLKLEAMLLAATLFLGESEPKQSRKLGKQSKCAFYCEELFIFDVDWFI